jgi:hypothetical protein
MAKVKSAHTLGGWVYEHHPINRGGMANAALVMTGATATVGSFRA